MKKDEYRGIIFCATLKDHPTPPENYSEPFLVNCPLCKEKMWLSIKKKEAIDTMPKHRKLYIGCTDCFIRDAKKGLFGDVRNHRIKML